MHQLFPDVILATCRTRLKKLLAQPGKQVYCQQLEDAWHDIWLEHRGTKALPDPNPNSLIDFDLKAHVRQVNE